LIGGLTGLFLACLGLDIHIHDTYFVSPISTTSWSAARSWVTSAAFTSGGQKLPAGLYPETLSRIAAVTLFVGFNLTFFPQFILGYLGMPRRYHTYPPEFQVLTSYPPPEPRFSRSAICFPCLYLTWSMRYGKVAGKNPWPATGLEWTTDSPPPTENFHVTPEVTWEPYDYLNRPDLGLAAGSPLPAPAMETISLLFDLQGWGLPHPRYVKQYAIRWMAKRSTECIAPDSCTDIFKHSSSRRICHARHVDLLVTEVLFFGGMFLAYTINRSAFSTAFGIGQQHAGHHFGAGNTVVLIMSSLTMAMAVWSAQSWQKRNGSVFS